jgi:hypothetical protein
MKTSCGLALLSAAILALCAIPADAASNRTFVSGTGSDSNPCSRTSPCASFQEALGKTAAGGEVDCLDPGDFGGASQGVTISQSVSIVCDGVSNGGIINNSGSAAITINGTSGTVVYLSGLDLNGMETTGNGGVVVNSGSAVYIVHCTIRGFGIDGVYVRSSTNPTRVFIKDSIIVNNNNDGVYVNGSGTTNVVIMVNTIVDGNLEYAASAASTDSAVALTQTMLTGGTKGLYVASGATGELVGPSNVIAGAITGTTTSVPFK